MLSMLLSIPTRNNQHKHHACHWQSVHPITHDSRSHPIAAVTNGGRPGLLINGSAYVLCK